MELKVYLKFYWSTGSKLDLGRYDVHIQLPSLTLKDSSKFSYEESWREERTKKVDLEAIVVWYEGKPDVSLLVEPNYSLTYNDDPISLEALELHGEQRHMFPVGTYCDYRWEYTGISKEDIPHIKEEILKAIEELELSILENDGPWEYQWAYRY